VKTGWLPVALWGAAAAAWAWLWRGSRGRARLLDRLSARYGGFVRGGFSWITLCPEPRDVSFVVMVGAHPCRVRVRYLLPPRGGAVPATAMEVELPEAVFGHEPGGFGAGDLAGGRGLFLAGTDVTAVWRRYLGELPPGVRPRLRWGGPVVQLAIPGLLSDEEEVWVSRAVEFLVEVAGAILPGARPPGRR